MPQTSLCLLDTGVTHARLESSKVLETVSGEREGLEATPPASAEEAHGSGWSFMCKRNSVALRLCRRTHLVDCHQQRGTKLLIIIKIILSIYKLILHLLGQHWRVSSVLALTLEPSGLPGPALQCWPPQASQAGCSRPSIGSWFRWGELGLGGPLGLELLDGVECLVESESGCQCKERYVRGRYALVPGVRVQAVYSLSRAPKFTGGHIH